MHTLTSIGFILISVTLYNGFMVDGQTRIIGGKMVRSKTWPGYCRLHQRKMFVCGAVLVTPKLVITAGHCVVGEDAKSFYAHCNTKSRQQPGTTRRVCKTYMSAKYTDDTMNYDVALCKLCKDMPQYGTRAIGIYPYNLNIGSLLTVYGHGATKTNLDGPIQLHEVTVPTLSCGPYKGVDVITNTMFCAGLLGVADACFGDSGGPIIYQNQLVGIVSWGFACASNTFPGVYTNCTVINQPFIRKIIRKFG